MEKQQGNLFYIETYGCQMNVADSELVASILVDNGYRQASDIDAADLIIFNTCTVRQHAEDRVIGRISNEMSRKKQKPHLKIGVIGCVAQRLGEKLLEVNAGIDFVLGVDQYKSLPMTLRFLDSWGVKHCSDFNSEQSYEYHSPLRSGKHNAFVTITRGCDNYCSYCIVPYTRGRERSRLASEIVREARQAGEAGFRDITLLGQNVNSYNNRGATFPDLLEMVNDVESIRRIRFITSHPKDLSARLISVMQKSNKVCEHIHLPMQSGNTEILKRMNRGYTARHYWKLIEKLRDAIPNIAITTDVIVGFPGETEEQFDDTMEMMKRLRFDAAFMFKYSVREGTEAAGFENEVPEEIRLERLKKLINLQTGITTEKYQQQTGLTKEVYVEGVSKKSTAELSGKTRDAKVVVFPGDSSLIGSFVNVEITDAIGWTLKGRQLSKE
ncbi:MAG: tRNA (N6-isopentenyl adenosine(37)-C2)-methylthiotransferase MiaB [Candidatus Cloacimonetes bacterium]|nr:tRNA (N6-isopentenyl adenosine(37)-C2)-methylthiotransferase MiaB [Candidatus Cloacimonadota bacterium]